MQSKSEAKPTIQIKAEGFQKCDQKDRMRCRIGMQEYQRKGRGRVHAGGWERRREKGERGKEKTRLPQHDLQIALSPWRLLSALPSIQSGSPNSGATICS